MLNDLEVKAGKILNVNLMVEVKEKVWTILDTQFSEDFRMITIMVQAFYGLRTTGTACRSQLADFMHDIQ